MRESYFLKTQNLDLFFPYKTSLYHEQARRFGLSWVSSNVWTGRFPRGQPFRQLYSTVIRIIKQSSPTLWSHVGISHAPRYIWQLLTKVHIHMGLLHLEDGCLGSLFPQTMQIERQNMPHVTTWQMPPNPDKVLCWSMWTRNASSPVCLGGKALQREQWNDRPVLLGMSFVLGKAQTLYEKVF